jgi:DNA modification methylase
LNGITILQGDALEVLKTLPDESVHCVVTSPPYWGLRDYGCVGQIGLESTPAEYIAQMVAVFAEVKRVLRGDGTLWLNMGDCYNQGNKGQSGEMNPTYKQSTNRGSLMTRRGPMLGSNRNRNHEGMKPKDLVGMPWMLAFALRADGWWLRRDIIWHKPNPMPESVTDRCTTAHEYLFHLSKKERYFYNQDAVLEPVSANTHARLAQNIEKQIGSERANGGQKTNGNMKAVGRRPKAWDNDMGSNRTLIGGYGRKLAEPGSGIRSNESFSNAVCCQVTDRNKRSVWTVNTQSFSEAHFATFPEELIRPCILAGCPAGGTVLDPFFGSGTTGLVARANGCKCIGIELNPEYIRIAERRLAQEHLEFAPSNPAPTTPAQSRPAPAPPPSE